MTNIYLDENGALTIGLSLVRENDIRTSFYGDGNVKIYSPIDNTEYYNGLITNTAFYLFDDIFIPAVDKQDFIKKLSSALNGNNLQPKAPPFNYNENWDGDTTILYSYLLTTGNLILASFGDVNLDEIVLANTDLSYANSWNISLIGANLADSNLTGAMLTDANLYTAYLNSTNLTSAYLLNANLTSANLEWANFTNAYLVGATLSESSSSNANFTDANLEDAILQYANLSNADFTNANLRYTYLDNATLVGANFTNADLRTYSLVGTNLEDANLTNANLSNVNLDGTNLTNTNLTGANFTNAVFINAEGLVNDVNVALANVNKDPNGDNLGWYLTWTDESYYYYNPETGSFQLD